MVRLSLAPSCEPSESERAYLFRLAVGLIWLAVSLMYIGFREDLLNTRGCNITWAKLATDSELVTLSRDWSLALATMPLVPDYIKIRI